MTGDVTNSFLDSTIGASQYITFVGAAYTVDGNVTNIFENTAVKTTTTAYVGSAGTVTGTVKNVVKGTSSFASSFTGAGGTVGKIVNEISGGTFTGAYFGSGETAVVTGLFAPPAEEGAEPVQTEIASITNTVTGGKFGQFYPSNSAITGDVTSTIIGQTDVPRDELKEREDELIYIGSFQGNGGEIDGNFTYTVKNVSVGGEFLTRKSISGLFLVDFSNVLIRVGSGNFQDCQATSLAIKKTVEIYKDCYVDYTGTSARAFQIANKSSSFDADFIAVFENFRIDSAGKSGNAKPMNSVGGDMQIFLYGDVVLNGDAGISLGRKENGTQSYLGAKPVFDENWNVTSVTPTETTVTANEHGIVRVRTSGGTAAQIHTVNIYDVTFDGSTFELPTGYNDNVILHGDIALKNGATVTATKVADDVDSITVSQVEDWEDGVWVTIPATELDKIEVENRPDQTGIGAKDSAETEGYVLGGNFDSAMMNVSVDERIKMNAWFAPTTLRAYMGANGVTSFTVKAVCEGANLGTLTLDETTVEAYLDPESGYYKIPFAVLPADMFDKAITLTLTIGNTEIVLDSVGENALTVLNLAKAGADEMETLLLGATDAAEIASLERSLNLFKALYNYGAAFSGDTMYKMDGFVEDNKEADPTYTVTANNSVSFNGMYLLMGDAVGIRLKGVSATAPVITAKLNGEDVAVMTSENEAGVITVSFFVNANNFNDDLVFEVFADGELAVTASFSVKGYTEFVKDYGNKELALAQLVQACYNITEVASAPIV